MSRSLIYEPTRSDQESATGWRYWGTLPVMLASVFMITLDFFIVNVAVPSLQQGLGASAASIQMIVAGYGLTYAAGLITGGRLGDIFGRRRIFMIGIGLFTLASLACGLAPTAGLLVAARVVQGIAAALATPQEFAILGLVYKGAARGKAFGAAALVTALAGVFGQLLGGLLIAVDPSGLGWRLCFLINIPFGIAAIVLAPRVVPESRATPAARLDPVGILLVTVGLVAVVLPLIEGRERGWPLWSLLCLAASVPLLAGFAWHQGWYGRRGGTPVVDPVLFSDRGFSVGIVMTLLYNSCMASFFLVFAIFLQQGRGMTALGSGVIIVVVGVGFIAASVVGPGLAARLGRQVIALGSLTLAVGWVVLVAAVDKVGSGGSAIWFAPALLVIGFGMGSVVAPLASTTLATLPTAHAGAASGAFSTSIQIGNALGVAVIGIIFYGALGSEGTTGDFATALTRSLFYLIALSVAVAVFAQFLPRAAAAAATASTEETP